MMANKLKHYHLVVGVDFHTSQPPGPVPPVPMQMHSAGPANLVLGPWGIFTGKPVDTVFTGEGGITLQQGTDIGPMLPHVCLTCPASLLTPVIILTSASKSYFGASSTKIGKDQLPVAVAVMSVVNLNLDCHQIVPLPTGIVLAMNSVVAEFTVEDLFSGIATMMVEIVLQTLLNLLFSHDKSPVAKWLNGASEKVFARWLVAGANPYAAALMKAAFPTLAALAAGSPLGLSGVNIPQKAFPDLTPWASPAGQGASVASHAAGDAAAKQAQNYFNNPAVDQHPSAPPADAPAPSPAAAPAPAPAGQGAGAPPASDPNGLDTFSTPSSSNDPSRGY